MFIFLGKSRSGSRRCSGDMGRCRSDHLNFVLFDWRYDFGRPVLEPTAGAQWAEPLRDLAGKDQGGNTVPDRDLVLALTPTKVKELVDRFGRVRVILGANPKKAKFDAILTVTTTKLTEAQEHVGARPGHKAVEATSGPQHGQARNLYLVRTRSREPRCAVDGDSREAGGFITKRKWRSGSDRQKAASPQSARRRSIGMSSARRPASLAI